MSHGAIYKSLFIQARGLLKKELMVHLRSRRIMRRAKTANGRCPVIGSSATRPLREFARKMGPVVMLAAASQPLSACTGRRWLPWGAGRPFCPVPPGRSSCAG